MWVLVGVSVGVFVGVLKEIGCFKGLSISLANFFI